MYRLNILEQRKKKDNCCGGNGPNCKCSSTKDNKKNSMVDFFKSMSKNFIEK